MGYYEKIKKTFKSGDCRFFTGAAYNKGYGNAV